MPAIDTKEVYLNLHGQYVDGGQSSSLPDREGAYREAISKAFGREVQRLLPMEELMKSLPAARRTAKPSPRDYLIKRRSSPFGPLLAFDWETLEQQEWGWKRGLGEIAEPVGLLLEAAKIALKRQRLSVIDKEVVPPSGDKHDYMTLAPYWWPNPDTNDGLPYVSRDGERIPEMQIDHPRSARYDASRGRHLFEDITALTLAWRFTRETRYAERAFEIINIWFVKSATRMNPHLEYAQVRLGHRDNRGTAYGIIEFRAIWHALDAIRMLREAELPQALQQALLDWLADYLQWLTTSELGKELNQPQTITALFMISRFWRSHRLSATLQSLNRRSCDRYGDWTSTLTPMVASPRS